METGEAMSGEIKVWNIGIAYFLFDFEFWRGGVCSCFAFSVYIMFKA